MTVSWRSLRMVLGYALAVALIVWAAVWAGRNWERLANAFLFSPGYLVLLVPAVAVSVVSVGWSNQLLASHLGAPLRAREWVSLAFASVFMNQVLPLRAGLVLRAGYYRRRRGFPIAKFISCTAAAYLLTVIVNALVLAGALVWIWLAEGRTFGPLLWAALGAAALCVLVLACSPRAAGPGEGRGLWGALGQVRAGWDTIRRSPRLLAQVAGLSLVTTLLYALRLFLAFQAVGHAVDIAGCLFIGSLGALSVFIAVSPGGLGILEGAVVFAGMALGVSPEVGLLAGAMDRSVTLVVVLIAGPLATALLSRPGRDSS